MQTTRLTLVAIATGLLLTACGGGSDNTSFLPVVPEEKRVQDSRNSFAPVDANAKTFAAMAADPANPNDKTNYAGTARWAGVLEGAAYRVEVPSNWNGKLVMYAHGYAGEGNALVVTNPSIRRYLLQNGYAWAASSYSKNFYDVRVGVEDTNNLALNFSAIAQANGVFMPKPTKTYITGHSMGGHITAAAVDAEALVTARHKVAYDGAVPMCGVVGDTELFDYFAGAQVAAQALTGQAQYPFTKWADIAAPVQAALFSSFPSAASPNAPVTPTALGTAYASIVQNLTGGPRPMFAAGFSGGGTFPLVWGVFGGDGTINGILNKSVIDTNRFTYTVDGQPAISDQVNSTAQKLTAVPDANRLRTDGLRWVPKANGDIHIPVVSIHTLGDMYVPFSMEQVFNKRVASKGNSQWLVQRAIRGISHCDFTVAEQVKAFDDMIKWANGGPKPAGDDVVTPATVANSNYGCTFTNNTLGVDDGATTKALRPAAVAFAPCTN